MALALNRQLVATAQKVAWGGASGLACGREVRPAGRSLESHRGAEAAESTGGEAGGPEDGAVCGRGIVRGESEEAVNDAAGSVVFVRLQLSLEGVVGCAEVRGDVGDGCRSREVPEGGRGSTVSWVGPERLGTGSTGGDEPVDVVAEEVNVAR